MAAIEHAIGLRNKPVIVKAKATGHEHKQRICGSFRSIDAWTETTRPSPNSSCKGRWLYQ